MSNKVVIAIDGPAGAGKSTVAKALAKELGIRYLDTGAMYRALAWKAKSLHIAVDSETLCSELLERTDIKFGGGDPQVVLLDGEDVTDEIRSLEVGDMASAISQHSAVRRGMVVRQQALVAAGGVVLEGRDATTVIAPNATVKVYLTASLEERAKRRHLELATSGANDPYEAVRQQVENRDHRDINRDDSPLTVASDAVIVESAGLTVEQVVAKITALVPA